MVAVAGCYAASFLIQMGWNSSMAGLLLWMQSLVEYPASFELVKIVGG